MHRGTIAAAVNGAIFCGKTVRKALRKSAAKKFIHSKPAFITKREDVIVMKKSTLIAWVAFFSAIAGALAAAYFYIQRREKELEEYEQLLFSEDFCDEAPIEDIDVEDYAAESEEPEDPNSIKF